MRVLHKSLANQLLPKKEGRSSYAFQEAAGDILIKLPSTLGFYLGYLRRDLLGTFFRHTVRWLRKGQFTPLLIYNREQDKGARKA